MYSRSNRAWRMVPRYPGLDRNPLRRRSDHVQAAARLAAGVLLRADSAHGYPVAGRVLSSIQRSPTDARGAASAPWSVRLAWRDRDGRRHVQTLVLPDGRAPMSTIPLWVDAHGQASTAPRRHHQAVVGGMTTGLVLLVGAARGVALSYGGVLAVLNRRRLAAWDTEWAAVEPRWRRQAR